MILYYKEDNGDYLCIDTSTNDYYIKGLQRDYFEGRAAAIAGQPSSVCTTSIDRTYLKEKCLRIPKRRVPKDWQKAIEG